MSKQIAVIGAGIIGTMTALALVRQGERVTIIDPAEPGGAHAASFGNGAWLSSQSILPPAMPGMWREVPGYLMDPLGPVAVRPSYFPVALPWLLRYLASGWTEKRTTATATALRLLLKDAPRLHAEIAAEVGRPDLIAATSGLMHVFASREEFLAGSLGWRIRKGLGIDWQEMENDELRAVQPDLSEAYRFAVLVGEAGHCKDPSAYVAAIFRHLLQSGAVWARSSARGFRIEDGRLRAVVTDTGEVTCEGAVIAAGAHSKPLGKAAGDDVPLETERGYHVTLAGARCGPTIPVIPFDAKMVITMLDTGLRAAGQVEIAGLKAPPNMARARILETHLRKAFPGLDRPGQGGTPSYWMGHRPSLPDGLPCLGLASSCRDIVHAFGTGHVGLVGGVRMGRLAAQIATGKPTEISVQAFDTRRFRMF